MIDKKAIDLEALTAFKKGLDGAYFKKGQDINLGTHNIVFEGGDTGDISFVYNGVEKVRFYMEVTPDGDIPCFSIKTDRDPSDIIPLRWNNKDLATTDQIPEGFEFVRVLDSSVMTLGNGMADPSSGCPRNFVLFNGYGGDVEIYSTATGGGHAHSVTATGPIAVIDVTPWGINVIDRNGAKFFGEGLSNIYSLMARNSGTRWIVYQSTQDRSYP